MNHKNIGIFRACLLFVFCCFIHKSSIIMILLLPFIYIKPVSKFEFNLAPVLFIVCAYIGWRYDLFSSIIDNPIFLQNIADSQYSYYLDDRFIGMGLGNNLGLGFFLKFLFDFLLIISGYRMANFYCNDRIYLICFRFFYLGKCLKYLVPTSMVLGRPILYLTFFTLPILAYYLFYVSRTINKITLETLKNLLAIIVVILLFFANYFLNSEGYMSEFHFVWEK